MTNTPTTTVASGAVGSTTILALSVNPNQAVTTGTTTSTTTSALLAQGQILSTTAAATLAPGQTTTTVITTTVLTTTRKFFPHLDWFVKTVTDEMNFSYSSILC